MLSLYPAVRGTVIQVRDLRAILDSLAKDVAAVKARR